MADGGGLKATLELLVHFHGFRNIDLRSRGQYCVEVVAYPASCPNPPGVPIRTFYEASARKSMARGVAVSPCEGDMEHRGMSCTSQGGLPAYATSVLSVRFTNEQVQLNEGCLFRLNIDADWVETEVIAIGCRLMNRALPEGDGDAAPTEEGDAGSRDTQPTEEFKEVGKVTLHAKCAASRGGLHRYHPLVFPQPHLCQLDVTLHMALTSMNHSGGPAGLSSIISAAAFPSEDSGAPPAPRPYNSPVRSRAPAATPTQERRHSRSASAGRLLDGSGRAALGVTPLRPRFMTPGRARKRAIVGRSRSASFGAGVASLGPAQAPPTARQHRMPLSKAALEAASTAAGLSAALGYAAGKLNGGRSSGSDGDEEKSAREVYRAAELLYSRHALGLRWSRGALEVAKAAAMATEDPKTGADKVSATAVSATAVSATVLAAKRRSKGKSKTSRRIKPSQETGSSPTKVSSKAANASAPRNGENEDSSEARGTAGSNGFKEETTAAAAVGVLKNMWDGEAHVSKVNRAPVAMWGQDGIHRKPPPPPPCKEKVQDADVDAVTEVPSDATPKSDVDEGADVRQEGGLMGGERAAEKREGHATERGSAKAKTAMDLVAWTWGETSPTVKVDIPRTPLPSDLRQLSWLIHTWLTEESAVCSRAWSAFAKATFERGRRGLSKMREEWLRDTTRAWSGQCLETMSVDRGDLLRLNKALLDPEGFLQLRARAGVRLKRRASPIGSRSRGGARYSRKNAGLISAAPAASAAAVRVGSEAELKLPNGLARLQALEKALSVSGSWIEGSGAGFVIATSSSSPSSPSSTSTSSLTSPTAPAATVTTSHSVAPRSGGGSGLETEKKTNDDIDDEDDEPPLLDALERRGEALRCAAALAALSTTPRKRSSSLVMSWGAVSPWNYGGGGAQPGGRPEQVPGWLSRLAAAGGGGGGSSASSPTNSNSGRAASFSQWSGHGKEGGGKTGADAKCLTQSEMAVAAADYPPPPQSLLPVFNRELHGFDHAASEEERWGELPFLVVESWGGLDDDILTAPCSPILLRHETSSTATVRSRQPSPSRKPPSQPAPPLPNLPPLPPALLATPTNVAGGNGSTVFAANSFRASSSCDESAPTEEAGTNKEQARKVVKTKRGEGENAAPEVTSAATASTGPPPLLPPRARSISMEAPIAAAVTAAMSPPKSSRGIDRLNGSSPGSEKTSIWDHPSTGQRQPRGPKFSAAKRRLPRPPGLTNLNIPPTGASGGGGVSFSERDRRDSSDSVSVLSARSGDWAAGSGGGGGGIAGGSSDNYDDDDDDFWSGSDNFSSGSETRRNERRRSREVARRSTKRAEIRRRMWGRRPSWTTALLAPSAPSASGSTGAAAARPRVESGTNHLIVFVHGLGGRPADMALMRGYLQTLMPAAELMVSTSLQDMRKDNLGVEAMGRKLAEEVHTHIMRFCPYLGSSTGPTPTDDAATANGGSLPLSPVTPMRYPRGDMRAGSTVGGSMDGDGAGGKLSTPLRNRGGGGGASPSATRGGVHASPGAAAAARAISEEIAATGHKIAVTPSRPTPTRQRAKGAGTGEDWSRGGGNTENTGMLSFVCFSMGGLIARSALLEAAMAPYLSSLQCFVTLACPHLGQTSTPLSFFKTGAWAVRKLTGLRVLHELDLDDADNVRDTTLYRLNLSPGLEQFRTVVFAANPRDGFVPLHSASVRCPPEASSSSGGGGAGSSSSAGGSSSGSTKKGGKGKKDAVSKEMARMLMSKMDERVNRVVRMTVDAPRRRQAQGALDSVIGRAGHMCFIDSAQVAWLISLALLPFMEEQGS